MPLLQNHFTVSLFALSLIVTLVCVQASASEDEQSDSTDEKASPFEAHVYTSADGGTLPYRLLAPSDRENPMSVILFLHGAGERGDENERQLIHGSELLKKAVNQFGCLVVAPQCPAGDVWSSIDRRTGHITFQEEPAEPLRLANELLDELATKYPIDTDRMYVMGLSMGGFGSWDAISRWPGRFAAAVPICGGGDTDKAPEIKDTPVWVFHGDADPVVAVELSRNMVNAIKDAGGDPKYTEYAEVGHGSWIPAFAEPELLPWMTAQSLDAED